MEFVEVVLADGVATLRIGRSPVNAINAQMVTELHKCLHEVEADVGVHAVVLTGSGAFFSFGFDIPEILPYSRDECTEFLIAFTALYARIFAFPKPIVGALNGHAIAGGCMLALACDYRIMVNERAKIALNEISFGATVFAGAVEMLRFWIGNAGATEVLSTGAMYSSAEAKRLRLVHEICARKDLLPTAHEMARNLSCRPDAFRSIKSLLRSSVRAEMGRAELASIQEFVEIWYSDSTRASLVGITID